jgi:hypothetical protein
VPGALQREVEQGIWTCGTIPPELVLRQVGSQSERPLGIERKIAREDMMDTGKPLWEILHECRSSTAMPVSTTVAAAVEQLPGLGALREVPEAGGSGAYFSGLKRSDLQALAKKYGTKAVLIVSSDCSSLISSSPSLLSCIYFASRARRGLQLKLLTQTC